MRIRPAEPDDIEHLREVERRSDGLLDDPGLPDLSQAPPATVEELAAATALLVADVDGEPVGFARMELVDGRAHLEQLSVDPDHGRQGYGAALLEAACDWAAQAGHATVTLTTFRDVPFNRPFYQRHGFVVVPDREWTPALRALVSEEAAHGLDPAQRVVMRRPLVTRVRSW